MDCNRYFAALVVIALAVCIAGILILPQVDLPDFVMNRSKSPTITTIHVKNIPSPINFYYAGGVSSTVYLRGLHKSSSVMEEAISFLPTHTPMTLRC